MFIHTYTAALLSVSACLSAFPSPPLNISLPFLSPSPFPSPLCSPACEHYFKPVLRTEGGREADAHRCAVRERGEGKADRIWSSSARAENGLNRGESKQKGNQERERQELETKDTVAFFLPFLFREKRRY